MTKKGWFALDIDGTLTSGAYTIPQKVISYLKNKHLEGWEIIVLTGRSYPFALPSVSNLDFPYILSTQNGSSARHMPSKDLIFENFFEKHFFIQIENETKESQLALIGYGEDYRCYCRNNDKYNSYIDAIVALGSQERVSFTHLDKLEVPERFSLIKLAGPLVHIKNFKEKLHKIFECEAVTIKDPFHEKFSMLLMTKKGVSKGSCVERIKSLNGGGIVIAAGNDHNDLSMFKSADISIAMEDSPEEVLQTADVIAPSPENHGIIEGLDVAVDLAFNSKRRVSSAWK